MVQRSIDEVWRGFADLRRGVPAVAEVWHGGPANYCEVPTNSDDGLTRFGQEQGGGSGGLGGRGGARRNSSEKFRPTTLPRS